MHPLLPPLPASGPSTNLYKRYGIPSPNESSGAVEAHGHTYHPISTGTVALRTTVIFSGVGLAVSAIQNALETHNRGLGGLFSRTGGTIGYFAAIGFAYSSVTAITANVRETNDAYNNATGGCAAGFAAGIKTGSLPMAVGGCAFMGSLMAAFVATGNTIGRATGPGAVTQSTRTEGRQSWFKQNPKFTQLAEQGQSA